MTIHSRVAAVLFCMPLVATLPGCLAYEVRNELRRANESLEEIELRLSSLNDSLLKIERTNTLLSDLDITLQSLEATNSSLAAIEQHLSVIRENGDGMQSDEPSTSQQGELPAEPPVASGDDPG